MTRPPSAFAGAVPRKVIELDDLAVRAGWRSRGVGHLLLEVSVHGFNRDARRFYEKFGFAASIDRLMLAA
ncbi:MAG: GNAT family N-acetyltransferase [Enhydrobacter sp.]|nr:MAG: GNAT family N-acetyltransferase [Enhydrobacter sp.]